MDREGRRREEEREVEEREGGKGTEMAKEGEDGRLPSAVINLP